MYVCTLWRAGRRDLSGSFATLTRAAVFGKPIHTAIPHMLLNFETQVTQGQVTRSRDLTSEKSLMLVISYTE